MSRQKSARDSVIEFLLVQGYTTKDAHTKDTELVIFKKGAHDHVFVYDDAVHIIRDKGPVWLPLNVFALAGALTYYHQILPMSWLNKPIQGA